MNARHTVIQITLNGVDISEDINKYLISMTYSDHDEDKTDDLQIEIDDRDGVWLRNWLNADSGIKGSTVTAVIIQKNWNSDNKDKMLDCGSFEIDSINSSGSPARISLKGTSVSYNSTMRMQKKTKAWENISLAAVAKEIAKKSGLMCMFESSYNPIYKRREQIQQSDIVFLQELCKASGISLKVTSNIVVLFDEAEYEQKNPVKTIEYGNSDVLSYRFSTNLSDTSYSKCRVSYTDPQTNHTIEYTYTPRDADKTAQVLEINEKVNTREEARQLAMKRLRQKNKGEFKADFSMAGDVYMVAGVTVNVSGWGMFDGKYIIETATHNFTGGYTTNVQLHRVLEGY